jgi:hypothetical protein
MTNPDVPQPTPARSGWFMPDSVFRSSAICAICRGESGVLAFHASGAADEAAFLIAWGDGMTDTAAVRPGSDTAAGGPENGTNPGGLSDVRNILGFLVAGFVGALNLLGLKSAEIGVVLRNDLVGATIVATFLLAGILCAMASVFVKSGGHPIPLLLTLGIGTLLASLFPVSVWIIPTTFGVAPSAAQAVGTPPEVSFSRVAACILWGISAVLLLAWAAIRFHRHRINKDNGKDKGTYKFPDLSNLQSLLLLAAILLTSTATYGVMRLEAVSQTSTVAELGDTLQAGGQEDALTVSVSAVKLTTKEWLGVNIMAAPRRWNLQSRCLNKKVIAWQDKYDISIPCQEDPCYYFNHALLGHCRWLSSDVIPPDSSGAVQRTLQVLFSPRRFQHIYVTALTCAPAPPAVGAASKPAAGSTPQPHPSETPKAHGSRKQQKPQGRPAGTCLAAGGSSRLDIAIPGPPHTGTSK